MTSVNRWVSVLCGAAAALAVSTWGTHVALTALLGEGPGRSGAGRWCAVVTACPPYRPVGDHPPTGDPGRAAADIRWPVTPTAGRATGQPNSPTPGRADRPAHW